MAINSSYQSKAAYLQEECKLLKKKLREYEERFKDLEKQNQELREEVDRKDAEHEAYKELSREWRKVKDVDMNGEQMQKYIADMVKYEEWKDEQAIISRMHNMDKIQEAQSKLRKIINERK